jgi:hypothetical protein
MIATTKTEKGEIKFRDESEDLKKECGEETLQLVQAAMRAGLMEFTTPTPEDGEGRIDWKVRRFVTLKGDKPACYLVAQKVLFEHFEILGPELVDTFADSRAPKKAA